MSCSMWHQRGLLSLGLDDPLLRWLTQIASKLVLAVSWELSQAGDRGPHLLSMWDFPQAPQISSCLQIWVLRASVPGNRKEAMACFLRPGPGYWHRLPASSIDQVAIEPRLKRRRHRPHLLMEGISKNWGVRHVLKLSHRISNNGLNNVDFYFISHAK